MTTPLRLSLLATAVIVSLSMKSNTVADTDQPIHTPRHVAHLDTHPVTHTGTRVLINGHNEYQSGKYVWVPAHYAMAPTPDAIWVSPGAVRGHAGIYPGHWSTEVPTQ